MRRNGNEQIRVWNQASAGLRAHMLATKQNTAKASGYSAVTQGVSAVRVVGFPRANIDLRRLMSTSQRARVNPRAVGTALANYSSN
jgi:hypothetical protein